MRRLAFLAAILFLVGTVCAEERLQVERDEADAADALRKADAALSEFLEAGNGASDEGCGAGGCNKRYSQEAVVMIDTPPIIVPKLQTSCQCTASPCSCGVPQVIPTIVRSLPSTPPVVVVPTPAVPNTPAVVPATPTTPEVKQGTPVPAVPTTPPASSATPYNYSLPVNLTLCPNCNKDGQVVVTGSPVPDAKPLDQAIAIIATNAAAKARAAAEASTTLQAKVTAAESQQVSTVVETSKQEQILNVKQNAELNALREKLTALKVRTRTRLAKLRAAEKNLQQKTKSLDAAYNKLKKAHENFKAERTKRLAKEAKTRAANKAERTRRRNRRRAKRERGGKRAKLRRQRRKQRKLAAKKAKLAELAREVEAKARADKLLEDSQAKHTQQLLEAKKKETAFRLAAEAAAAARAAAQAAASQAVGGVANIKRLQADAEFAARKAEVDAHGKEQREALKREAAARDLARRQAIDNQRAAHQKATDARRAAEVKQLETKLNKITTKTTVLTQKVRALQTQADASRAQVKAARAEAARVKKVAAKASKEADTADSQASDALKAELASLSGK